MAKTGWVRLLGGLFALTVVLAACGGDEDGGDGSETGGGTGGGGNTIVMESFAFEPATVTVSGPTEFTITNNDSAAHTFTLDDGSIDVELAGGGESTTVTIDVSSSTGFVCRFHPQMTGTVEVA